MTLPDPDDIHHAWLCGWNEGYAQGRQAASEDLARALLHEQAAEIAASATSTARKRHGDGWAAEIQRQCEAS